MNTTRYIKMNRPDRFGRSCFSLLITFILVLSGCSTNPVKEAADDDQYGDLYSASDEVKRTHEATRTAETAEEAIALGDKALHKGEYDEAVFQYIKAMELNEGDTETLNKIGDIQNRMGKYAHAGQAYQLTLDMEPDNQRALEGLGLIQLRDRNYEQAKANLLRALELKPDLWRAHNALGTIADLQGDHAAAIIHYRKALLIQPNTQNVINNYGYSLYLSGDWNAALGQFRKAINSNPDFERAWYNIGLVYARQGRTGEALAAFDNVMGRPQAYNDIGYICMIDGKYMQAEAYFKKAIKVSSTYYKKAHNNLEKLYRLKARSSDTAAPSRMNTGRDSGNSNISGMSGSPSAVTGRDHSGDPVYKTAGPGITRVTPVAETSRTPVVQEKPAQAENVPVAPVATTVEEVATDTVTETGVTDSVKAAEDVVKPSTIDLNNTPNNTNSMPLADLQESGDYMDMVRKYRGALLMINRKQYTEAATALDLFLTAYPGSQHADNASYWLGESYYLRHDYDRAEEIFTNLVNDYPNSPMLAEARLKLGYLHYEKQDWSEARQELSLVVNEYPGSEAAQLANYRLKRMGRNGH